MDARSAALNRQPEADDDAFSAIARRVGGLGVEIADLSGIVADLHELARGEKGGRETPEEITLFKSVGAALEDLAAAVAVFDLLGKGA